MKWQVYEVVVSPLVGQWPTEYVLVAATSSQHAEKRVRKKHPSKRVKVFQVFKF
jgi:hypothetical protein